MDNLVSILRVPTLNHDVKSTILRMIQNWSIALEGKPHLSYVGQVYKMLLTEGMSQMSMQAFVLIPSPFHRIQVPSERSCSRQFRYGRHSNCTRMDRFRRLSSVPDTLYIHEPQASLPQLRSGLRSTMFFKVYGLASFWYHGRSPSL